MKIKLSLHRLASPAGHRCMWTQVGAIRNDDDDDDNYIDDSKII